MVKCVLDSKIDKWVCILSCPKRDDPWGDVRLEQDALMRALDTLGKKLHTFVEIIQNQGGDNLTVV